MPATTNSSAVWCGDILAHPVCVGLTLNPVGLTLNPVGLTLNPVGLTLNPVGLTLNPVGLTLNPVPACLSTPHPITLLHAPSHAHPHTSAAQGVDMF